MFCAVCSSSTVVVIPYLRLNTAANKLDSNEQLLFLSLQNQKGFNMHNAISLTSVVYDVTNFWITHIKCVIVARCYSTPPPFRQSHVDDEENALVVLIVVLKMWIEGSVQDHHVVEGFRLVDHHFRDKLVVTAPTLETNSGFSLSLCLSHVFLSSHLISSSAALLTQSRLCC